jgi:hypothetical protein
MTGSTLDASAPRRGGPEIVYTYKVVEVREKMIGGKMSGEKLENLLNDHAREGWRLRAITSAEVKGRVGPGGVEGLLVTFERSDGV